MKIEIDEFCPGGRPPRAFFVRGGERSYTNASWWLVAMSKPQRLWSRMAPLERGPIVNSLLLAMAAREELGRRGLRASQICISQGSPFSPSLLRGPLSNQRRGFAIVGFLAGELIVQADELIIVRQRHQIWSQARKRAVALECRHCAAHRLGCRKQCHGRKAHRGNARGFQLS